VGKLFGVYNEGAGVENRGRFIIDPDGVVQGYEVLTPPVGRNVQESLRQVQAFQLVRKTKGAEATPSGWRPGKLTLKPGPDLVGNVWKVWKTIWPSTNRPPRESGWGSDRTDRLEAG
jgi:alkyl hydroperoxide reductase subunit AhpC